MAKNKSDDAYQDNFHSKAGFYSDAERSPYAAEFMQGTQMSFMQMALEREYQNRESIEAYTDSPDRKLTNQERFQGSYTFCMDNDQDL